MKKIFYIFIIFLIFGCKEDETKETVIHCGLCSTGTEDKPDCPLIYNTQNPVEKAYFDKTMAYIPDSLKFDADTVKFINHSPDSLPYHIAKGFVYYSDLFKKDSLFYCEIKGEKTLQMFSFSGLGFPTYNPNKNITPYRYYDNGYIKEVYQGENACCSYDYTLLLNPKSEEFLVQANIELSDRKKVEEFFGFCRKNNIIKERKALFSVFYDCKLGVYYPLQHKSIVWLGFISEPTQSMELWVISGENPCACYTRIDEKRLIYPPIPYKNVFILYDRKSNEMVEMVVKEKKDSRENELLEDSIYHYFYVRDKEE